MQALRLADQMLTTPQLVELLCIQAAGDFFRSPPSLFYGGTILGYAAAFNLKEAVRAIMLMDRVASEIDLLNRVRVPASQDFFRFTPQLPMA